MVQATREGGYQLSDAVDQDAKNAANVKSLMERTGLEIRDLASMALPTVIPSRGIPQVQCWLSQIAPPVSVGFDLFTRSVRHCAARLTKWYNEEQGHDSALLVS